VPLRSSRFLSVVVCATLTASIACNQDPGPAAKPRLILIGIDGASPRIVEPMMAAGQLPNLAKIAERGVYGRLRSEMPVYSPRIWNTIVTGKTPKKHGIVSFFYKGPDDRHHLYASTDRRVPALWSIANDAGLSVGVVNFWNTYPLERVDGVMVSDHVLAKELEARRRMTGALESDVGVVIYPDEWNSRLVGMVQDKATPVPGFASPFAEDKVLPRWAPRDEFQRRFDEDGALARMAQEISRFEEPDVMMVLLTGIDRISHHIWGVMEPPDSYPPGLIPTPEGREGGKAALFGYYEYTDALIGALAADFGPDDLVMVISDHGFEAARALLSLTGGHDTKEALDGVVFASGLGIEAGGDVSDVSVYDIAPTILAWLGLPVAKDMDGRIASFLIAEEIPPIDTYDAIAPDFVNPDIVPSGVKGDIIEELKALGYGDSE
jgi:predicted AlkP superfamily phosphohydrolase/phosphomutase